MATLTRREPLALDWPHWMSRFLDDRRVTGLEGFFDKSFINVERYVDDGTLVVRAEMPGVDVDKDVDISVHDGMLHIKAERNESTETREKSFYRSEFRYGAFERTVALPPGASIEDVKASYQDGILEVRVPTAPESTGAVKVPITHHDQA